METLVGKANGNADALPLFGEFDWIIGRNAVTPLPGNERTAAFASMRKVSAHGATLCLAENVPQYSQRLCALLEEAGVFGNTAAPDWLPCIAEAEDRLYANASNPVVNWNEKDLADCAVKAGWKDVAVELFHIRREFRLTQELLKRGFDKDNPESFLNRMLEAGASREDAAAFEKALATELNGKPLHWNTTTAIVTAANE